MVEIQLAQAIVPVGGRLQGRLTWTSTDTTPVAVTIRWRTEGRGTIDRQMVKEIRLETNQSISGPIADIEFEFEIPHDGPVSYDGVLLRIMWEVKVVLKFSSLLTPKPEPIRQFRVIPRSSF